MRRSILALVGAFAVLAAVAAAGAFSSLGGGRLAPVRAGLEIRHAEVGCHAWSPSGGAYETALSLRLREGESITVVNHDTCPQLLVQTAGPAADVANVTEASLRVDPGTTVAGPELDIRAGLMTHVGDGAQVAFLEPGEYTLVAEETHVSPGGDVPLTLHVLVFPVFHHPYD